MEVLASHCFSDSEVYDDGWIERLGWKDAWMLVMPRPEVLSCVKHHTICPRHDEIAWLHET